MSLKLKTDFAKAADNINTALREHGKYVGTITRAERLVSSQGTIGLGLSFRADSGQTADYLDLYHTKETGEDLPSMKTVHAILCCAKVAEAKDGYIDCEKWNPETRQRDKVKVEGYPDLMGKRIGFLFQEVIETDNKGKDREKIQIFGVFNAETELTASEMIAKKTTPERLSQMVDALAAKPVRDIRKNKSAPRPAATSGTAFDDLDSDIPF